MPNDNPEPQAASSHRVSVLAVVENHVVPFFGAMDVSVIREEQHILAYVRTKLTEPSRRWPRGKSPETLKPATIRNHLATLRRVLALLEREGRTQRNLRPEESASSRAG